MRERRRGVREVEGLEKESGWRRVREGEGLERERG